MRHRCLRIKRICIQIVLGAEPVVPAVSGGDVAHFLCQDDVQDSARLQSRRSADLGEF